MRPRFLRAVTAGTLLCVVATFAPTTAGAAVRRAPLSDEYCDAFSEYYTVISAIEISVALFEAFSSLGDDEEQEPSADGDDIPDVEQLRSTFYAVLSPKLAALTGTLADEGPKAVRGVYQQAQQIFDRGVELLRDAGLTDRQIEEIATTPIDQFSEGDITEVTGDVPVDEQDIENLANTFRAEVEKLDFDDLSPKAGRILDRSTTECGVEPSRAYDCEEVLPAAEAEAALDDEVTRDDDGCAYSGPEPVDGLTAEIEVVVYDSGRPFESLTAPIDDIDEVSGVGDEARASAGFSADGRDITCGRTLYVLEGDVTVVVALCLGGDDPEVTDDQLVELAEGVLERIA
jgi:hypothetical protein